MSQPAGKPFVAVNCGTIPENLVESILFGREKGAFNGATTRHIGKFQEADGGTLFLDEIGELRPDIQVKMLRALQESEIDPVGGNRPVKINVRLISATNRDLVQRVAEGVFRENLFYRLNVFPISVPPLREQREDVPALVEHFVAAFAASERRNVRDVMPAAMTRLVNYAWPGNVRQLENMIYRAVVLADGHRIDVEDLPQLPAIAAAEEPGAGSGGAAGGIVPDVARETEPVAFDAPPGRQGNGAAETTIDALDRAGELRPLDAIEAEMIRLALNRYRGQMSEAARRLGIGRSTLYRKVREYGIVSRGYEIARMPGGRET